MNYNKGGCQPQITQHLFLERNHAKLADINHNIHPTLYNHISQMKGRRYGTRESFLSQYIFWSFTSEPHWISNVHGASYVSMHVFRCLHVFTVWIPNNSLWDTWLHFILIDRKAFWMQKIYFINNCSLTPD